MKQSFCVPRVCQITGHHPKYAPAGLRNDIILLHLIDNVKISVCLSVVLLSLAAPGDF